MRVAFLVTRVQTLKGTLEQEETGRARLSIYTYAFPEAVEWTKVARDMLPGIRIVAGGHHPSACLRRFFWPVSITWSSGRARKSFAELLSYIALGEEGPIPPESAALSGTNCAIRSCSRSHKNLDLWLHPSESLRCFDKQGISRLLDPPASSR